MGTLFLPDLLFASGRVVTDVGLEVEGGAVLAVRPPRPGEDVRRLPGRALVPGLVNAHSHAFQRLLRGKTEFVSKGFAADDFWSWRELMYRAAVSLTPEELFVVSRQAFVEMALAGITTVGEFHYLHHQADGTPYSDRLTLARQVIAAAREVGIRIVLLRVAYARAGFGVAANPRQLRFIDPELSLVLGDVESLRRIYSADTAVTVGLAPHSVRAVPREWLAALPKGELVHMHVAEQPAEIAACLKEHGRRPVELLGELGLLSSRFTAVHGVHLTDAEVDMFGRAEATVCACPSTERNLGDGVVPADALLRAGAAISLGSDSQANISLLEEARQLELHLRLVRLKRAVLDPANGEVGGLGARLLTCATAGGARSLGLPGGELLPGTPADFFTVDLSHPSMLGATAESFPSALIFGGEPGAIRDVFVAGRPIVENRQHPLQPASAEAFSALARRLT